MKNLILKSATAAAALLALAGVASAQSSVTATTDLNIRSGPGPQYAPIGVIGVGQQATLDGCIRDSKWCMVEAGSVKGWSYSDYLTGSFEGAQQKTVVVTQAPREVVPAVTYEGPTLEGKVSSGGGTGVATGAATGAVAGALIAGPIGAAVGGVAGAATGTAVEAVSEPPPPPVRQYVTSNPSDPVYLDGEVVVGAGVPDTVQLREVPDYQYRYVDINGQPVLVDPQSRRIVYVYRQ